MLLSESTGELAQLQEDGVLILILLDVTLRVY